MQESPNNLKKKIKKEKLEKCQRERRQIKLYVLKSKILILASIILFNNTKEDISISCNNALYFYSYFQMFPDNMQNVFLC